MSSNLFTKYFVLKPWGTDVYAQASRAALDAYATAVESEDDSLAHNVRNLVSAARADAGKACTHLALRDMHLTNGVLLATCEDCDAVMTADVVGAWRPKDEPAPADCSSSGCDHNRWTIVQDPRYLARADGPRQYFVARCDDCGTWLTRDVGEWRPMTDDELVREG